jgi:hypothetical protein
MGLVGVSSLCAEQTQSLLGRRSPVRHRELCQREKALEPQHPVQRLGRKANDGLAAPTKVALRDEQR